MKHLSQIKKQAIEFLITNKGKLFFFLSLSIIIYQYTSLSNYSDKYYLKVNQNKLLIKKLDSLNLLIKEARNEIMYLENRFNDESAITEQYSLLKINRLVEQKHSGKISYSYPNGNVYVQGTLNNGNERGLWEYYNIDKSINVIYDYPLVCVGSQCCDGTTSSSVGRGTCSWHGGVCATLYEYRKRYLNIAGIQQ
jgi:hypothetical protein